ncbi:MAG: hypothetical protein QOJ99_1906, partial [Bryobacterales bacterium]|nr:hypothetical protein [Bryobacterales bacterium]
MSLRNWLSPQTWLLLGSAACLAVAVAEVPPKSSAPAARKKTAAPRPKVVSKSDPQAGTTPNADTDDEKFAKRAARLWSLQPVRKPEIPAGFTKSANPIDAFIAETYQSKGLRPTAKAD